MNMCDVIFKEMTKNIDDLGDMEFFLELRNGFEIFYRDVCISFYNHVLGSGLEKSIEHYNKANTGRILALRRLKKEDDCLKKGSAGELKITNSYWPAPYTLALGSAHADIKGIYVQLVVDDEQTAMPAEIVDRMKTNFGKLAYATSFGQKETGVWFYYDCPYNSLNNQETILSVIADVALFNKNQNSNPTFAAQYINDMMELVGFVDHIVEQADDRSKLIAPKRSMQCQN